MSDVYRRAWQQAYMRLTEFIAGRPEIEVSETVVRIPSDVRPEFYRLFNEVRMAFLQEYFSDFLNRAKLLSESYKKAEEEVIKLLGLEGVHLAATLQTFLRNPEEESMGVLFDPLFDLLKGRINFDDFEKESLRRLEGLEEIYRLGYVRWVELSLVKLLEPDRALQVILRHPSASRRFTHLHALKEDGIFPPQEVKRIWIEHHYEPIFTIPDFIVHSAKIGKYIAFRSEFRQATWSALDMGEGREWCLFNLIEKHGLSNINPDLLVYVDEKPDGLSLIADRERVYRPDLLVECATRKGWHEKELETAKAFHQVLLPRLGTFIVSSEPMPEESIGESADEIRVLAVGFDQSKLTSIVTALMELNKGLQ